MTNVEVVESLRYGLKLFAYLLGIGVLGAIGVIGSVALFLQIDGSLTDNLTSVELIGGLALGVFSLVVWGAGMYAVTYKLIADSVQRGVAAGTNPQAVSAGAESTTEPHKESPREQVGPSPGEQTAREFGPHSTVPSAANVPDRQTDTDSVADAGETTEIHDQHETDSPEDSQSPEIDSTEQPPADEQSVDGSTETTERTAEEIAFGTGEEGEHGAEPANEAAERDDGEQPSESGSIPPYEAMDDSATAATETDESVVESGRKEPETDHENETVESGREDSIKSRLPYKTNEASPEEPPETTVQSAESPERPGGEVESETDGDPLSSHNSSGDDGGAFEESEETSGQLDSGDDQTPDGTTKSPSEIVESGEETDTSAVPFAADDTADTVEEAASDVVEQDAADVIEGDAPDAVEADDTESEDSWDESVTETGGDRGENTGEDSVSQRESVAEDNAGDSNDDGRDTEGDSSDEDENSRDPLSDPF